MISYNFCSLTILSPVSNLALSKEVRPPSNFLQLWTNGQNFRKGWNGSYCLLFQKALDTVSHRPLVELMKYNQIDGSVVYYISDFWTSRTQQVLVDGIKSIIFNVSHIRCATRISTWNFVISYIGNLNGRNSSGRWMLSIWRRLKGLQRDVIRWRGIWTTEKDWMDAILSAEI